jgi:hypothetical protein
MLKKMGQSTPKFKYLPVHMKKLGSNTISKRVNMNKVTSRAGALRPRVTSRVLLNKWQHQKEKDYQRRLQEEEYERRCEEERYEREQAELHWSCPFFRHC